MTEPLVGVDNIELPSWMNVERQVAEAGLWRTLQALPAGVRVVLGLAWQASRRWTLVTGLLTLASGCATAFGLLATADVFTQLLAVGPTPERVVSSLPSVALLVGSFVVRALVESGTATAQALLKPRVEQIARDKAHTAIARVDLIAFEDSDYADLVRQGLQRGMSSIEGSVEAIGNVSASVIQLGAAVFTAAVLHPLLAPLVLLAVVPDMWASARAARLSYQTYVRMVSRMLRMQIASELLTQRSTAAELRACTAASALLGEYRRISGQLTEENSRLEVAKTRVRLVGRAVAGIGSGLAYGALAGLLYGGALPLALAGAAVVAMRMASTSLSTTMYGVNQLYENILYLDLYTNLMSQTAERTRAAGGVAAPIDPSEITLSGVTFTYPGQDEPAVRDVALTVRRGEVVALVGENGSGKSTLATLITGLFRPSAGEVRWDGADLAEADESSVYDQIAMVMQAPAQWPMTADDNIRIGRIDRHDPDGSGLSTAAAQSGAESVIAELPDGGRTVLSRRFTNGRDLSGGQWQRISVARGLYRDAPILVADEPTAAMDARAEHEVFRSLQRLRRRDGAGRDRTTILITHRLANIRHADQIIVLDHGKVVERGTHAELMALDGTYAQLFTLQAEAYQPAEASSG